MSISKGEKAALNAVLKDLGIYEQFIEGCKNFETGVCNFGPNGSSSAQILIEKGVKELTYNFDIDSSVEGQNVFLSTEIGNLNNLTALAINSAYSILGKPALTGSIPTEIGNMQSLEYLNLVSNKLSGLIPTEIGNLKSLDGLFLDDNCLRINKAGINAIKSLNAYRSDRVGLNHNCIDIGTFKGITESNCANCPNPTPKPNPKYRTVYNNRTGCFTICKKK